LLRICLAKVLRHAPPQTEVIVVDDGSRGAIVSHAVTDFPGVKVVRHARARGFCAAVNAGIAAASRPIVELLNDDTEVTEGWADAALAPFADSRVGAVAPLVLQLDPMYRAHQSSALIDTAGDEYDPGGFARKRGHGQLVSESRYGSGPVFGASACAAFYRRAALLEAGGFPEHFRAYFEDVDLSHRLRRFGHEIFHEPASVVWHHVSSTHGKWPSRRILELQSCNEERVFWRNLRGKDRFHSLSRHGLVLAAKAVRRLQEGTFLPWFLGRVRAVSGW
jgi:GT2 family glycosyltransferase